MFRRRRGTLALAAAAIVLGAAPLPASEVRWTGAVRLRYEGDDRSFAQDADLEHAILQRTRVQAEVTNDRGARVLIQLQDSRLWGGEGSTLSDAHNVDLHQAYVRLRDPNFEALEWFLGRQEIAYANERVFSTEDWDNVGRAFDAARVRIRTESHWFDLGYGKVAHGPTAGTGENVAFAVGHIDAAERGLSLDPLLVYRENSSERSFLTSIGEHGSLERDRFRAEQDLVYQTGRVASGDASAWLVALTAGFDLSAAGDGSAGVSVGYSLDTGDDPDEDDDSAYHNLYYDSHRYHGSMDIVRGIVDPLRLGLRDIFLKGWARTGGGVRLRAALHSFASEQRASVAAGGDRNDLGTEWDFQAAKELSSGMSAEVGAAIFLPGDVTERLRGDDTGYWIYAQGTTRF